MLEEKIATATKRERKSKPPLDVANIETRLLLTLAEAAYLLRVSETRMYRLIKEIDPATRKPKLPSIKDGKHRVIPRKALDRYIEARFNEAGGSLNSKE